MYTHIAESCIAFEGPRCIAKGDTLHVAQLVKSHIDSNQGASILIFDTESSRIVEMDLRGSMAEVTARIQARLAAAGILLPEQQEEPRKVGRPRLGVVAREITLLPRHWEWLEGQPGGASVTLRKLIDETRKSSAGRDRVRQAQEAAYRFMNSVAGDLPGFQEALRALYANNRERFTQETAGWPDDIRDHTHTLAARVFDETSPVVLI